MNASRLGALSVIGLVLVTSPAVLNAQSPTIPSASPAAIDATPAPVPNSSLRSGTYVAMPFAGQNWAPCAWPVDPATPPPCPEATADDSIRITFTVPEGWEAGFDGAAIIPDTGVRAPAGQSIHLGRGGWLRSDPCSTPSPDVPVGPTVDDFASALEQHPQLAVTAPADVTLGGYAGTYLELEGECPNFFPWEPGFYGQGPGHRWHVWILDVDGLRVVIQTGDFPGTSAEDRAELQAIVRSMRIDHAPSATPSAMASLDVR